MAKQLSYQALYEIFSRFQAAQAEPKGELDHVNAYTLVVAVALSAQATDKGVNRATAELFKIADTPQKMLDLGEEQLTEHIKTIGLYRNKAKNVIKLSRILVEEYGGWRGAAVVLSGLFLNMCVCGALFRDLEWTARRKRKKSEAKKSQSRKISGERKLHKY